jgi:thymidine kinase
LCSLSNMKRVGTLHLIVGCMYSGKTDELLRQIRVCRLSGGNVVLLKYAKDTRYSQRRDLVSSHNGMHMDGAISVANLVDPIVIPEDTTTCIAIDEGQFLEGIEDFVATFNNRGVDVIVSGLWTDFQRNTWARMVALSRVATRITWLNAICILCKSQNAAFSKRVTPGEERELIGGDDQYVATCATCFDKEIPEDVRKRHREVVKQLKTSI